MARELSYKLLPHSKLRYFDDKQDEYQVRLVRKILANYKLL